MTWLAPPIWMIVLFACWLLQAGWSVYNAQRFLRRARSLRKRGQNLGEDRRPAALLVLPVKGDDGHLAEHAALMLRQNYNGTYRVVFSVQDEADPAFAVITELIHDTPRTDACVGAELVIAGPAEVGGQKVHNQLAALERYDGERIAVFADADAAMGEHWLSTMIGGALKSRYPAATGYRWLIPLDDGWASRFASVINGSAATLLGHHRRNMAWGGSMAIDLDAIPLDTLREHWRGALSDDYQFSAAVRSVGGNVYFVPAAMTVSPVRYTWASLVEFARRQYRITRMHALYPWCMAALLPAIYLAALGVSIAGLAMGYAWAGIVLAAVVALDIIRGRCRRAAVKVMFDDDTAQRLRPAGLLDTFATPIWLALQLVLVLSSAWGRTIRWAGISYLIRSPRDVRIVARDEPPTDR